jgi:hypothetical protein
MGKGEGQGEGQGKGQGEGKGEGAWKNDTFGCFSDVGVCK